MPDDRFKDVVYWLDESIELTEREMLKVILDDGQADQAATLGPSALASAPTEEDQPARRPRFDLETVTHIISRSWNIPERHMLEADEKLSSKFEKSIWIVKPEWAFRSSLMGLQAPQGFSADPKLIFSGIIINCSDDFPEGDVEAIYGAVSAFGGQSRRFATKEITHLICVSPTPLQFEAVTNSGLGIKMVVPEWIQECIKLGRLVPIHPFEFTSATEPPPIRGAKYHADPTKPLRKHMDEVLSRGKTEPYLGANASQKSIFQASNDGHIMQYMNAHMETVTEVRRPFEGKKVLLGRPLEINAQTKEALDEWIKQAGGVALPGDSYLPDCDIYITKWREGPEYSKAVQLNKTIGTLMWFYHVLKVNRLTSPMDELLHYPVPQQEIEEFKDFRIAVTNYTGDSREYIKKLITTMGATWTNNLSRHDNTHLVASNVYGDKVTRAREWDMSIVNHFWLEDCFIKWASLSIGNPRYTEFPAGVNYMTLLGQAHLSRENISRWVNEALAWSEEEEMSAVEQDMQLGVPTQPTPKVDASRSVTREAAEEVDLGTEMVLEPIADAGPSRTPSRSRGSKGRATDNEASAGEEENEPTPKPKRRRVTEPRTPAAAIVSTKTSEALPPPSTGRARRQAATKAGNALHEMAEDMNLYNKEKKRKDIIPPSERKAARTLDEPETSKRGARPRAHTPETEHGDAATEQEDDDQKPSTARGKSKQVKTKRAAASKKARSESVAVIEDEVDVKPKIEEPTIVLLTTGATLTAPQTKFFKGYGVKVNPNKWESCDYLLADSLKRTSKFLQAINSAPAVVSLAWVQACMAAEEILEPREEHLLRDPANEAKLGFKLKDAIGRAKEVREEGGLLRGTTFLLTNKLIPNVKDALLDAIPAAGGRVEVMKSKRTPPENDGKTFVVSNQEDKAVWKPFADKGIPVVDKEYVLAGIFAMHLDLPQYRLDE